MHKLFAVLLMAFLIGWSGGSVGRIIFADRDTDRKAATIIASASTAASAPVDIKIFLVNALQDGMLDIAVAELALQKSSNNEIRNFAQRIITDRTRANNLIRKFAQERNIALPNHLSANHRKLLENLSGTTGNEFDLTYMHHNLMMHELQVRPFREQAESGADPDIRNFAINILPVLQAHLLAAEDINRRIHPAA